MSSFTSADMAENSARSILQAQAAYSVPQGQWNPYRDPYSPSSPSGTYNCSYDCSRSCSSRCSYTCSTNYRCR
jgi:hypothetical protein